MIRQQVLSSVPHALVAWQGRAGDPASRGTEDGQEGGAAPSPRRSAPPTATWMQFLEPTHSAPLRRASRTTTVKVGLWRAQRVGCGWTWDQTSQWADRASSRALGTGATGLEEWPLVHSPRGKVRRTAQRGPPPPGSARAALRAPEQADELKARLTQLSNITARLKLLKKTLYRNFWEISTLLGTISDSRLYEAKGYASFEAFSERELDLGKATCPRLLQLARVFQEPATRQAGLGSLLAALDLLEGEREPHPGLARTATTAKPLKPPDRPPSPTRIGTTARAGLVHSPPIPSTLACPQEFAGENPWPTVATQKCCFEVPWRTPLVLNPQQLNADVNAAHTGGRLTCCRCSCGATAGGSRDNGGTRTSYPARRGRSVCSVCY